MGRGSIRRLRRLHQGGARSPLDPPTADGQRTERLAVDPQRVFRYSPRPFVGESMLGFSFLIAVVALVLAVVFWFQGQSAASVVKALRDEADAARKEAEVARGELRKATEELKARSTQLT